MLCKWWLFGYIEKRGWCPLTSWALSHEMITWRPSLWDTGADRAIIFLQCSCGRSCLTPLTYTVISIPRAWRPTRAPRYVIIVFRKNACTLQCTPFRKAQSVQMCIQLIPMLFSFYWDYFMKYEVDHIDAQWNVFVVPIRRKDCVFKENFFTLDI